MEEKTLLMQVSVAGIEDLGDCMETEQKPEIFVQQCLSPELEGKLSLCFENIQTLLMGICVRSSIFIILFIILIILLCLSMIH